MTTLAGKTVTIIGGSSGIGYGIALASLQSLASLVIIASSSPSKVENAIARLTEEKAKGSFPGKVTGKTVDLEDFSTVESLFHDIGEIDHLIITSALPPPPSTENIKETDMGSLKDTFNLRYWGALQAVKCAKLRTGGSITFTIGASFIKPPKGRGLPIGVLGAVDAVTRGLAVDLAPIRVNCISPGLVDTEMIESMFKEQRTNIFSAVSDALLVKHIATPAEIAEAYLFVMKCGYITGETVHVNGGYTLSDMPTLRVQSQVESAINN